MSIKLNVDNSIKEASEIFTGLDGIKRRIIKVVTADLEGNKKTLYQYSRQELYTAQWYVSAYFSIDASSTSSAASFYSGIPFFSYLTKLRITCPIIYGASKYETSIQLGLGDDFSDRFLVGKASTESILDKTFLFDWKEDSLDVSVEDGEENTLTGGSYSWSDIPLVDNMKLSFNAYRSLKSITSNAKMTFYFDAEYNFGK